MNWIFFGLSTKWGKRKVKEREVKRKHAYTKSAGVLCVRRRRIHTGTKIQIRAKQIFVKRATINVHHRTGVLCVRRRRLHVGTKIQIRAKEIFVIGATENIDVL